MNRFKKKRANPYQFSLVPETLWNPNKPLPALVFSRILSGVSYQDSSYLTNSGRTLQIPSGTSWVSIETIREDISSALGLIFTRRKIQYAIQKLKERSMLASTLMEPDTKGRYGLLMKPTIPASTVTTIDPVKEFKIHAYGKTSAFVHGGIAHSGNGVEWIQRQAGDVMRLMDSVAKNGNPDALFRTVGMWRDRKSVRKVNEPVYLPWIVLDIDVPGDMYHAHDTTKTILSDLTDAGVDMDRTFVSFSGSKGFHIAIATSQIGSPIFRDSDNARGCMIKFVKFLTDHKFDPSTLSPLQMLRLTGSQHQKTQMFKTTWVATRFNGLKLHSIIEQAKSFKPFVYPDPTVGGVEEEMHEAFEAKAEAQAKEAWEALQAEANQPAGPKWHSPRGPLKQIIENGVARGEDWGNKSGRDWAAFTLSCYCLAHPEQHNAMRKMLGMLPENEATFETVHGTMDEWNERCSPPLTGKEISQKVGSADRYLQRRQK